MEGMTFQSFPCAPGDMMYFDSFVPHKSEPNHTDRPRRALYLTYNRASEGDQRARYYADKHESFPPDIERTSGAEYKYRV
jgi:ectoine hydroxylase-related dioxygenase (phytanoyl-CoA dioxygenase family)